MMYKYIYVFYCASINVVEDFRASYDVSDFTTYWIRVLDKASSVPYIDQLVEINNTIKVPLLTTG